MWRLIYDKQKKQVKQLRETDGKEKIRTKSKVFYGDTLEDCFDEIDKEKLNASYSIDDYHVTIFSGGTRTIIDESPPPLPPAPD